MNAFSRMPAVPESARNSLTNGRRNIATPVAAQRLHERSLWLGRERARLVASSVMAEHDVGDGDLFDPELVATPEDGDVEVGWFRLPPVGNDSGEVTARVLLQGVDAAGHVYAVPTDDSGTATGSRIEAFYGNEVPVLQWVPVQVALPSGTTSLRIGVQLASGETLVRSVVVDADKAEEMSDGLEAPATWPKLSALFFEDADLDHSYDVDAIQRTASQHAHVAGRMPRTLAARSLVNPSAGSGVTVSHHYRLRVASPARSLRVRVQAKSVLEPGSLSIATGPAPLPTVGSLTPVGSPIPVPVDDDFALYEATIPPGAATPDATTGLLDLRVNVTAGTPVANTAIQSIRIEQLPSAMEDYDVTDGGRFACAPVRAIPADRFLPGDPVVDSFRLGSMQRLWSDRRTAVSNALFRAADHLCVHVSDWFPLVLWEGLSPEFPFDLEGVAVPMLLGGIRPDFPSSDWIPTWLRYLRGTPNLFEVAHFVSGDEPMVPWTSPLTALQTRHTVSADASAVVVMSRLWIENEGYGQRIWVSLWRDGLEVVPARPFEGHERGWREVGRIPVVPGDTHDLEMKVALGDEQGPFDYLLPGPTILIPGIVAWEIPTEASPNRVYWHGAVSGENGPVQSLSLVVPESRDFDVRKIRLRVRVSLGGGNHNIQIGLRYRPGTPDEYHSYLFLNLQVRPRDSWFSDWRIGDEATTLSNALASFLDRRAAGEWRLETVFSRLEAFELELE